jgi:hypothetical protein
LAGDAAMMGVQAMSARLFYDFCLDDAKAASFYLYLRELVANASM